MDTKKLKYKYKINIVGSTYNGDFVKINNNTILEFNEISRDIVIHSKENIKPTETFKSAHNNITYL